ncbi:MAG TPA: hypothetical protein PLX76_09530, partial [Cyclobacteriaceae bacterium]|nr:hypothetical protein [Cyclobacteriaceae bacterium]
CLLNCVLNNLLNYNQTTMKTKFLVIPIFCLLSVSALAQDVTVTDEELTKYATAMDSINEMSAEVKEMITELVKNNKEVTATRYNEISKIIADEARLAEAKATPEEITFVKELALKRDSATVKINQAVQTLAKDYVGAATFNKVRKALGTDTALKAKYDALMSELAKDNPGS